MAKQYQSLRSSAAPSRWLCAAFVVLGVSGALNFDRAEAVNPLDKSLTASIQDPTGKSLGRVDFQQMPNGVLVTLNINGLQPQPHAVHLHEIGACDAQDGFKSAGGHLSGEQSHGFLNKDGPHPGDMPNLMVGADGKVQVQYFNQRISLTEKGEGFLQDEDGTALIIHQGADDYLTESAGDAGKRVGCAVVSAARS